MGARAIRLLVWFSGTIGLVLTALGLFFNLSDPYAFGGVFLVVFFFFVAVGALVALRRPENPIGWIFIVIGLTNLLWPAARGYATHTLVTQPGALGGGTWTVWLIVIADAIGVIGWGMMVTIAPLLFPDGKLLSARWRPVVWLAVGVIICEIVFTLLTPGPLYDLPATIQNPIGVESLAGIIGVWREFLSLPLFLPVIVACVISLGLRFRRAKGDERQQIKWFAYAAALVVAGLLIIAANVVLGSPAPKVFTETILLVAYGWLPVSVGIAILKYRLYDIDVIVNRTLVYGALTALLALVYVGSVVLLERLLRPITGQGNELAIVVSTLFIAALFSPLRRRIQAFIDRRFYRRKYDAAKTLLSFSNTVRDEVDLGALTGKLVEVVDETMQPAHVSLWLREPNREA